MNQKPHLTFRFQNTLFAVAAAEVRGVLSVPELTLAPGQPACIAGVFNLHGVAVPVLNLSAQLGHCAAGVQQADCVMLLSGSRGPLGILANEVLDVKLISAADLVPVHAVGDPLTLRLATRTAKLGAQIAWLLQYGELAPLLVQQQLAAALCSVPANGFAAQTRLQKRTAALLPEATTGGTSKPFAFAVVAIEQALYGLDLDLVREFCEPTGIAPVPCCPPHIAGNMIVHGEILTVVDIRRALRLSAAASDPAPNGSVVIVKVAELTAGLLVDEVIAVVYVDPRHCQTAPAGDLAASAFVSSTTAFDDQVLNILNLPGLLLHGGLIVDDIARIAPPGSGSTAAGAPASSGINNRGTAAPQAHGLLPRGDPAETRAHLEGLLQQAEELVGFWEEKMRCPAGVLDPEHASHQLALQRLEQLGSTLARLRSCADDNNENLTAVARDLTEHIHTLGMQPLSTIFSRLPRLVRSLSKDVKLAITGGELATDARSIEELADAIMHILSHCVHLAVDTPLQRLRFGKPTAGTICLQARQSSASLSIAISTEAPEVQEPATNRMLRRQNFPDTKQPAAPARAAVSGTQTHSIVPAVEAALLAARAAIARLNGSIQVQSMPGNASVFTIELPIRRPAIRVLAVRVGNHSYAIPCTDLETTRMVTGNDVVLVNGHETVRVGRQPVAIVMLERLLELRQPLPAEQVSGSAVAWPCVIIKMGVERLGVLVDSLMDEQAVTVSSHGPLLKCVRTVAGSAVLATGEGCIVLNPPDLFAGALAQIRAVSCAGTAVAALAIKNN
jgi:chemotaxis protein histidine kinase CheA